MQPALPLLISCLAVELAFWSTRADVVLNEIHHSPDVKTEPVEFLELHNSGTTDVDLSGWAFTAGIDYVIPSGTTLLAGGYLVVAQDPSALKSKFGVDALGPWTGRLAGEGENVVLRNAARQIVDSVDYKLGFPWPTVGDAPGYSMELIHPEVDNDLGGHWRASHIGGGQQQSALLFDAGAEWRVLKGTQPPPANWRDLAFNDSDWTGGPAPVGYDPSVRMGTPLDDMRNGYLDFFIRRTFQVVDAASVTALSLDVLYDDGFKLWINGNNVLNLAMPNGDVPYDQVANPVRESDAYDRHEIALPPGLLREGDNVIVVQVANINLGNSTDAFFDCRLRATVGPTGRGPTPGRLNATFTARIPPAIRQVEHQPRQPGSGRPVRVSAKITSASGLADVTLEYQAVAPGNYIELSDASYASTWTSVSMNDAGLEGDAQAGDDIYTATLPASVQQHRHLVRYRIEAADLAGVSVSAPYPDDPQPNFAYFCYDGVPAWTGAVSPGAAGALGQTFIVGEEEMNRLLVYHLIAKRNAVEDCTWYDRSHGDEYFWQGTLVYDGRVYDHIHFRPRGGVWRYAMGKNMWKFDFNRGHDFEPRDNWGRKLKTAWTKLNLGANIQQGDYMHRGEQGLFESVGFRLFQLVDQPSMHTMFVQFRIIDAPQETVPNDQYTGDFWGLYLAAEQPNGRFLDEHGLADGNFYKMEGGWGDPNNIGPLGPTDYSDLRDFMNTYNSGPPESWWRANLNLRAYYGYQAIVQAIHHYDIADGKNYFYHRDPNTGVWTVVPWDLDLTWADTMYRGGQTGGDEPFKSRLLSNFATDPAYPAIVREFRNRVREIRDLLWNSDEAFRLIDEYARLARGTNAASIIDADRAQWDYNPLMNNGGIVDLSKAGTGRFYQMGTPTRDFAGMVRLMKNYVGYRATNAAFSLDTMADEPQRPARPTLTYIGPEGYPANRLRFRATPFSGSAFAAIQWRAAEISRAGHPAFDAAQPGAYEITPVWESGPIATPSPEYALPQGALRIGHLHRVRARYLDTVGRASNWSPPIEFTAGPSDAADTLVQHLCLSELMYNPIGGGDFEFVELHNRSLDITLELGGATFTAGIDFTFPGDISLPPGGYLLLTRASTPEQQNAFRAFYQLDDAVAIVGPYAGALANEGETVTLETASNGTTIFSLKYGDGRGWPLAADGAGHSMIPETEAVAGQRTGWLDYGGNWRASTFMNGSPGRADPQPPSGPVINELMAQTHLANPQYPQYDSNDWIELHNAGPLDVSLAGWYLSDNAAQLDKWAIPSLDLPAGAFIAFDEVTGFHTPITSGFGLNSAGEELFLSHLPGGNENRVVDAVRFKGQEVEFSWGRALDFPGCWRRLVPTRGAANLDADCTITISEIMYRPYDKREGTNLVDNTTDEYIELHNPGCAPVTLHDTNGVWRLDGGVGFLFPTNTTLEPGAFLLVVAFDPAHAAILSSFRQHYGIGGRDVAILGPYTGTLGNGTDRVAIEKPIARQASDEPPAWAIMDEVIYSSGWPWPRAWPAGQGASLQRVGTGTGSAPNAWRAWWPTPGFENFGESLSDFDADALPDCWETQMGLDPLDPSESNGVEGDPDADGLANWQEFEGGTDPRATTLRILSIERRAAGVELQFNQPAGRVVQLEAAKSIEAAAWEVIAIFPGQASARIAVATNLPPGAASSRFYRVQGQPLN